MTSNNILFIFPISKASFFFSFIILHDSFYALIFLSTRSGKHKAFTICFLYKEILELPDSVMSFPNALALLDAACTTPRTDPQPQELCTAQAGTAKLQRKFQAFTSLTFLIP